MSIPFRKTRLPARKWLLASSLIAAALAVACRPSGAIAADMAMPMKAPAAAPVYQWSGCYAGINGGGGAISSNFHTTVDPGTYLGAADAAEVANDGTGSANNSLFIGGGQIGCNWQSGTVVAGLEGDFDYFHGNANFNNNTNTLPVLAVPFNIGQQTTTNYLATVRPRIGIAADRNFAYVTGGVAFTKASYTETYVDGSAPAGSGVATASKSLTGWVAGAGWEYALTDHWLLRFEYLYAAFSKTGAIGTIAEPGIGTNTLHGSGDLVMQQARAGLNFKF
ncbi:MAG: outer membrane beta-barrel protein [Xanthobacteraceae bacterium]